MPNSIRSSSLVPVARDQPDSGRAGPAEPSPPPTLSAADSVEHSLPQAGRLRIACQRLRPEAILPEYKTLGAAGMDLYSCLPPGETITLTSGHDGFGFGAYHAVPERKPRAGLVLVQEIFGVTDARHTASGAVLLKSGLRFVNTFNYEGLPHHWYEMTAEMYRMRVS